jgi:hypothetical protein
MKIQTIQCPECPAWAIRRPTGTVLTSNPRQSVMEWWCACGFRAPAEPERGNTLDDQSYDRWNAVNRQRHAELDRLRAAERPWWQRWFRPD